MNPPFPVPGAFERGRLAVFGKEEVILGPYPTDGEWFNFVLRRDVEEIVSTLNPNNPADVPWIEKEREIARENDLAFTLRPLDPNSPYDNVHAGVMYLQNLVNTTGDESTAIAAYYQGLGSVQSRGLFDDTQQYVANVQALRSRFGG